MPLAVGLVAFPHKRYAFCSLRLRREGCCRFLRLHLQCDIGKWWVYG